MMGYAEEPQTFLQQIRALWQQWRSRDQNMSRLVRPDDTQQPQPSYDPRTPKRYTAAYWRRQEADYRDRLKNFTHTEQMRDYYENEANLCAAEAKKIEDVEAGE